MNERQRVYEMLDEFDTAMLVTHGIDGRFEGRPMQMAEVEPAGPIWFFTSRDSRKIAEIEADPKALLVFEDEHNQYLSISGTARVLEDPARVRRLWKDAFKVWFPEGVEDPDLVLMAVEPEVAEFWDTRGTNRLEYIFDAAKAYVTGERPSDDGDRHGRTDV